MSSLYSQSPVVLSWSEYFLLIITGRKSRANTSTIKVVRDVADWLVFLFLGILAIASAKGSWDAYSNEKTSWTIEQRPIPNQPTFIMCFKLSSAFLSYLAIPLVLGKHFTMSLKTSPDR